MQNFRNDFESAIAEQIERAEGYVSYENNPVEYTTTKGERRRYYPDFILRNGLIVEAKGFFRPEDRRKHKRIKEQHPELDVRIVFQNTGIPINRGSATTYAQWCRRHGIKCASKAIPPSWFCESRRCIV